MKTTLQTIHRQYDDAVSESVAYCAETVLEHGGPRSFGGALLFQHHAGFLRAKDNKDLAFYLLREEGLTDKQIDYVLEFRAYIEVR